MSKETPVITISVQDSAMRDRQLEQAISLLRREATGCGILGYQDRIYNVHRRHQPRCRFWLTQEVDLL